MGRRKEAKDSDADSPIRARVNDALSFACQGYAPAWIAAELGLGENEVMEILLHPLRYQREFGIEPKAPAIINDFPSPDEVLARAALERAASIAEKAARGPKSHGYSRDYVKPVYPRHPRVRRRAW